MNSQKKDIHVCVIGAGPSGLSALHHLSKFHQSGNQIAEIKCFEKQKTIGGMWNYSWRTGLDEYGEPCHNSMYQQLWCNGPKEALEFEDFTFLEYFNGKAIPSYTPRHVLLDYIKKRAENQNIIQFIEFTTAVKSVTYNKEEDNFTVKTRYLDGPSQTINHIFTHVIVAAGHYSFPNSFYYKGFEKFSGRILHSHDFRSGVAFEGERVLVIGSSFSGEDISIHCLKFGAKQVIITWHLKPTGLCWPDGIEERPMITEVNKKLAYFRDGTSAEIDSIILCTGYSIKFPFMADNLQVGPEQSFYPEFLYKGITFIKDGNNKLYFIGLQNTLYTFNMYDTQAELASSFIVCDKEFPSQNEMQEDSKKWQTKLTKATDLKGFLTFQRDYVQDLRKMLEKQDDLTGVFEILSRWIDHRTGLISKYREFTFESIFTGQQSIALEKPWMETYDDDYQKYLE